MPALTEAMKKILEGLAYADLAEMQPSRDKYFSLVDASPSTDAAATCPVEPAVEPEPPRRVGLFVGPFAPRHVFDYAADSCERMNAELVVLTFLGENEAQALIDGFIDATRPLPNGYQIETLSGDPERALRRVLARGLRLDFLVCDEQGYLGHQILATEMASELPVVMVTPPRDTDAPSPANVPSGTAVRPTTS